MMGLVTAAVAAGGAAVIAGVVLTRRAQRQRSEALQEVARRLGWGFREEVPVDALPDLERFELFASGRSKRMRNVLTSPPGEARAVVFDYQYVTGSGKSQRTHRQTVFYGTRDLLHLPGFSLRPENLFHRALGLFGYQDIDFPRRPEFSRLFLLRGQNERKIRETFSTEVLRFFEERPGVCAAGKGHEVLLWRPRGWAASDEIETLIREGLELEGLLAASTAAEGRGEL